MEITKKIITFTKRNNKKREANWIHYDKDHLMNTEDGMIVLKGTDLNNIKPNEIKGFDRL